ncbi:Gfo/Idh/MocA family protein [Caproicibacter fermentans]|uniref:Gfo/Idh/MocA family oxidoreductase n=1 Tax=Caproicibacter fermentans TaxID=2576756 RepID=A0A7G8TFA4_9FIRM|nr:Gfo/Idh/MocA family oxidoreductase [Caproicibacter fermentans]QNK42295.1 Gfo/Idh/MocA family oxidoreductase [Caproicibacter fermentans]
MKIGIVGAGLIVEVFLEAVKRIGALRPEAICVREGRMDRALELSEKYGIRTQYTDYAQMLNDPEIDFVYIALPNRLHYGYAAQALKSHVNVLVEKPAVLTAAEFKELARLAEENRLFLFECITTVHLPNFQDIKKRIGEIGPIRTVEANYTQYSSRYDQFRQGVVTNIFNPAMGGGALMDLNQYNVHFAVGMWGEPEEVCYYPNLRNGIDTSGVLVLRYRNFLCSCIGAKDSHGDSHVAIHGENGCIRVGSAPNECRFYEIKTDGGAETVNRQQDNRLYYELCNFSDIYDRRDYEKRNLLLEHSGRVAGVLEKARQFARMSF